MKKEKYENHLMHNCTEKGCFKSPKNKLKEKIIEILREINLLERSKNYQKVDNELADQILALFEEEKKKWAGEIENEISKLLPIGQELTVQDFVKAIRKLKTNLF